MGLGGAGQAVSPERARGVGERPRSSCAGLTPGAVPGGQACVLVTVFCGTRKGVGGTVSLAVTGA